MTFKRMPCSRSTIGKYRNHIWFVAFACACFLSWMLWLYLHYLAKLDGKNGIVLSVNNDSNDIDSSLHVSNESISILPVTAKPIDVNESINGGNTIDGLQVEGDQIGDTDQISVSEKDVQPDHLAVVTENEEESVVDEVMTENGRISVEQKVRPSDRAMATENEREPVVGIQEVKPNNGAMAMEKQQEPVVGETIDENGVKEGGRIQAMQPNNGAMITENERGPVVDEVVKKNGDKQGDRIQAMQPNNGSMVAGNKQEPVVDEVVKENGVEQGNTVPSVETGTDIKQGSGDKGEVIESDSCSGRYVYIHDLPSRFNEDMLKNCQSLSAWTDMCLYLSNMGLGPRLSNSERAFSNTGWFGTNQFSLEVVFHNRMKQYDCLTNDSSLASAIFVPFYAGLDVARYLWYGKELKDTASTDLSKWLAEQPEWKDMWGRNHFAVAGRISWDFRRQTNILSQWGNGLMYLPTFKNMTLLTIESSPWHRNDFAVPYPTYFHPSNDNEVFQWQNRMRRQRRRFLFSFAGAPRPNLPDSIRNQIIDQCSASRRKCKLLECGLVGSKCHTPVNVMKMFQSSVFCLQPPGDSYTRRSVFDSILAGCIPVFFHPGSAYVQYLWHLPKNYTKYSVFIPGNSIKSGNASIEKILHRIPREEVVAMREEVIRLISKVIYANPKSRLETLEDAFDIAVKAVLERVETVRRDMREGRNSSFAFDEEMSWKYSLLGTDSAKHEWDPFFDKANANF